MSEDVRALATELQAGRLALLVVGAALNLRPRQPRAYLLPDQTRPMEADEAARRLAAQPKPIALAGYLEGSAIRLATENPDVSTHPAIRAQLALRATHPTDGGLYDMLRRRFEEPVGELPVACAGAGVVLIVQARAVTQFEQDYLLSLSHSCGSDFADSRYPGAQGVKRDELLDAVAFLSFGDGGRVIVVTDPAGQH